MFSLIMCVYLGQQITEYGHACHIHIYLHLRAPAFTAHRRHRTVAWRTAPWFHCQIHTPPLILPRRSVKKLWSSHSTPRYTFHDGTDVGIPSFWWSFCLHSKIVSPFVASNSTVRPCVKTTKKGMVQAVFPSSSVRSNDVRCSPLLLDDDTPVVFAPALSPRSKEGRSNMDMTSTSSAVPVCVFCGEYTL